MSYPLTTTLRRIWACDPCAEGKRRALAASGKNNPDDEPITYAAIIEAASVEDAIWCMRAEPQHKREWRLFAVWCARQVQHLMGDERSIAAVDVAERYANGRATSEELDAARDAARDAAWDAVRASSAAWAAARAAWAAARAAAWDAAWDAARDAARDAQRQAFIQLVSTGTLPAGGGEVG